MTQVKKDPWHRNHLIRDAIGRALYESMGADPSIHLFGEGAHVKVHFDAPKIEQEFLDRVHTLPISEDGNTNFAVGAALAGVKPVVDIITADFMFRAFDSIANTAAKLNFVQATGETPKTMVIRGEFLTAGPTTGQRPEALFARIPGLNVAVPSTPRDAYGLMKTALKGPGVTVFFEDRMLRDDLVVEAFDADDGDISIPFGKAAVRRVASIPRLTIVTYGLARQFVEWVLDQSKIWGVELIDLRTLYPLDWETIELSAERTGALLVVEPDVRFMGIGAEIVASIAAAQPTVRVLRLGAPRTSIPASMALHSKVFPGQEQVERAIEVLVRHGN
ncbi:MAG: transketolase C-terminal domain-containing protein [Dehalococcoidia bacterium]|nr:transketolase C-terminal domain-containing protein [Dehalococcoidia bacterium]